MNRIQLTAKSKEIWLKYRSGGVPDQDERKVMLDAYWENVLPRDPDYSVVQWVEDGFPMLP